MDEDSKDDRSGDDRDDPPDRPDDPARGEDMTFPESFRTLMRVIFGPFNRR